VSCVYDVIPAQPLAAHKPRQDNSVIRLLPIRALLPPGWLIPMEFLHSDQPRSPWTICHRQLPGGETVGRAARAARQARGGCRLRSHLWGGGGQETSAELCASAYTTVLPDSGPKVGAIRWACRSLLHLRDDNSVAANLGRPFKLLPALTKCESRGLAWTCLLLMESRLQIFAEPFLKNVDPPFSSHGRRRASLPALVCTVCRARCR
jgi:hypothetical protein